MFWKRALDQFFSLFFPNLCSTCNQSLRMGELQICTYCNADLPYTDHHSYKHNPLAKQMWGRVQVDAAMALLHYKKGGRVQRMVHQIKYKSNLELGLVAGKMMGYKLKGSRYFQKMDCIFPVPLHKSRLKLRGYNQSELLAQGIASVLDIPILEGALVRLGATKTQTKRNRIGRFENMVQVFSVIQSLSGKNVLLVDDVITTGATIEACALKILEAGAASVRIAALAYTE